MDKIYDMSYKDGIRLGEKILGEINDENYKEVLMQSVKDMIVEQNEPCGFSFNFNGWWNGFFDTVNKHYPDFVIILQRYKKYDW